MVYRTLAAAAAATLFATTPGAGQGATDRHSGAVPLATIGTRIVSAAEVEGALGNKLLRLRVEEYRQKRQVLETLVGEALLEGEATRRGVSVAALVKSEVDDKSRPVSDEEVRAVFESARSNFGNTPEPEALHTIGGNMRRQRLAQRRQQYFDELRRAAGVRILLEPPRVALEAAAAAVRGPANAPVTIVEFTDFQCPYCLQMADLAKQIEGTYSNRLRVVLRHFPLPFHAEAAKAAEAAACAEEQGKFWEMHDRLFANQKTLSVADLKRHAGALDLDAKAFEACLDSGRLAAVWQKDRSDGERYGVTGTPSIFVNGRPLFGLASPSELVQVVEEELARQDSSGAAAGGGRRRE